MKRIINIFSILGVSAVVVLGACSKSDKSNKTSNDDTDEGTEFVDTPGSDETIDISTDGVQTEVQVLGNYYLSGARKIGATSTPAGVEQALNDFMNNADIELADLDDNLAITQTDREYLVQCATAFVGTALLQVAQMNGMDLDDPEVEAQLDAQMDSIIDAMSQAISNAGTLGDASLAIGSVF